ncbi:Ribosomal protein L25/L23 [candidate division TM7 genomosp. GTL1]|nr:Ribosomal protein L25/L23 [candidate division TM7 genomosp. GTL1]
MAEMTLIPRVSEKAYGLASVGNTYVFVVPIKVNKQQIADAVATQYGVKVAKVTTLVAKGKAIRFAMGKRRNPGTAHRKDVKKAYVSLVEGDSIKIFDEEEKK